MRSRAGVAVERSARQREVEQLRQLGPRLLVLPATGLVVGLTVQLLLDGWTAGAAFGGIVTATTIATYGLVAASSGALSMRLGADAERWTEGVLRKHLARRGWQVISHHMRERHDIDHVLIGPGGVFVIETKWTASVLLSLEVAASRLQRDAHWLAGISRGRDVGVPSAVAPLIVVWGTRVRLPSDVHGVTVLHGSDLARWARALGDDSLTTSEVSQIVRGIQRGVEMRDQRISRIERRSELILRGPFAIARDITVGLVAGLLALGSVASALDVSLAGAIVAVVFVVGAVALRRLTRWRAASTGLATGSLLGIGLAALATFA